MSRKYFTEDEMNRIGTYPSVAGLFGNPQPSYPKYNRPVTSRENFELLINGKTPYWAPNLLSDFNLLQPLIMKDAEARSHGGLDWFGIEWQYEPLTGSPMVKPGTRRLSGLENWREELEWPDLDAIDWEADVRENFSNLPEDRPNLFLIVNGYFERLADLTSFEDAFCYLIEEPEEMNEFYTRLTDWHIHLVEIAKKYYNADIILLHDDMGTQRSTFFSTVMYVEHLQPHYKRFTKAVHDLGMHAAVHSCGCISTHIPEFINSGFEMWEGQFNANNMQQLMDTYGDKLGQIEWFHVPPNSTEEEAHALIKSRIDGVGATGRYMNRLYDDADRLVSSNEYMYRISREKYDRLFDQRGY
ncbi:MAG: hypothetical protein IJ072_06625 [Oscillospiraceae bacterium]|nr:hypothetical protein [Oscillospiraceae bacterium]